VNIIDIIFIVRERCEHNRYHVLYNGNGVNIIDIMFYVMEMG
jgi:hypothetical protein